MKTIRVTKSHDINQLHGQLETAVPALRPREENGERVAVMDVQTKGGEIILRVPDEVDEAAVRAVITAHAPTAKEPPPDVPALWQTYKTNMQAASTVPQIKAVLVGDLGALLRAMAKGNRGDLNGA